MSAGKSPTVARNLVEEVLGSGWTREIWSGSYGKVLPVTVHDFELVSILPTIFYMFRFGHRRGKGRFLEIFGGETGSVIERRRAATIDRVAEKLSQEDDFQGFDGEVQRAILGDLLLSFCLENRSRAVGRQEQVQRVAPAHYMASWVDLPREVANLRFVPEMIVALLANQKGSFVEPNREGDKTCFAVGHGFEDNVLLRAFNQGMVREGHLGDLTSDGFQEDADVGLDQLLTIRLAQRLGQPPEKLHGVEKEGHKISNQRPIAEKASRHFSEDLRRFVRAYSDAIPRHSFVELLECCMAVGLTTLMTSTAEILFRWADAGVVPKKCDQHPPRLFVDCSNGVDTQLRGLAEQSLDDYFRRLERFPVVLMALRLLDHSARHDPRLKKREIPTRPHATEWINLLGDLLFQRDGQAAPIFYNLEQKAQELAEKLSEDYPDAAEILANDDIEPSPVWRMAAALTSLQGRKNTQNNVASMIDSALLINRPHGLASRRSVTRTSETGGKARKREVRWLVFTDAVLDYLVHQHVLPTGNKAGYQPLSLRDFLKTLRDRHGFCVDVQPDGLEVSNELLRKNRTTLERRLRDLGLLVGVNDSEAMKQLKPRFERQEAGHELD